MLRSIFMLLLSSTLLVGCASAGAGSASATTSDAAALTQAEIAAADVPTAYDLVDRLRRPWLRRDAASGAEVTVYMDNRFIGGVQALRDIPAAEVGAMTLVRRDDAVRRWGSEVRGNVIVITRR